MVDWRRTRERDGGLCCEVEEGLDHGMMAEWDHGAERSLAYGMVTVLDCGAEVGLDHGAVDKTMDLWVSG